jgi:hypothetical protein
VRVGGGGAHVIFGHGIAWASAYLQNPEGARNFRASI